MTDAIRPRTWLNLVGCMVELQTGTSFSFCTRHTPAAIDRNRDNLCVPTKAASDPEQIMKLFS
jgi:hypothetical protein